MLKESKRAERQETREREREEREKWLSELINEESG